METQRKARASFRNNSGRKPTTLWKRWKPLLISCTATILFLVGNPLLSERDGNLKKLPSLPYQSVTSRKPTTLWKRWKLYRAITKTVSYPAKSETHYSLKEMETNHTVLVKSCMVLVGNPLLSERDGNTSESCQNLHCTIRVRNPLLSERDGNSKQQQFPIDFWHDSQKPTTLWKRWKLLGRFDVIALCTWSETHYSLKEMETSPCHSRLEQPPTH